jgi:hypothetical protein
MPGDQAEQFAACVAAGAGYRDSNTHTNLRMPMQMTVSAYDEDRKNMQDQR